MAKVVQYDSEASVVRDFQVVDQLLPRHAFHFLGQRFNNPLVAQRIIEQGTEKEVVFHLQLRIFRKEQSVNVLVNTLVGTQHAEIKRSAAHGHIALQDEEPVPLEPLPFQIGFGFFKRKRTKFDASCHTVVQPAFVAQQFVGHPCGRRPAYDKFQSFLVSCPHVPKRLQGADEIGVWSVVPRQLIDEHNPLSPFLFEQPPEHGKRLKPVFQPWHLRGSASQQLLAEIFQLIFVAEIIDAGSIEIKLVFEILLDQVCLSNAAAAINSDKLRFV